MPKKIAVIWDNYARDTQIYYGDPKALDGECEGDGDGDWVDAKYPCHYVGVFAGETDEKIQEAAANSIGVHPGIISLIEIE